MRRLILIPALALLSGCFPPDTFGDMWSQLDAIKVPDDFTLVGKSQYGSRSGFMGSGPPEAINRYSAPWDEGELCDRLRKLAQTYGEVIDSSSGTCGFQTTIPSGWSAWILGVSRFLATISGGIELVPSGTHTTDIVGSRQTLRGHVPPPFLGQMLDRPSEDPSQVAICDGKHMVGAHVQGIAGRYAASPDPALKSRIPG